MLIFDFFAGTGSATQAFKDAGHTVITFEIDESHNATHTIDVMQITSKWLQETYGTPDFIWASPPCTAFSVASIGRHWEKNINGNTPKTEAAVYNQELVFHVRSLIEDAKPTFGFLIENPVGMLRKLKPVEGLDRHTVTYCQYGDTRMKPTDLWGNVLNWLPRSACKQGMPCHVAAPRGSRTGTQGLKNPKERSMIPYQLGEELLNAIVGVSGKDLPTKVIGTERQLSLFDETLAV
jgi:hypothetical protein